MFASPSVRSLLEIVEQETRYPPEMLRLEADLEADLGIDSVTLTAILADVARAFGLDELELREQDFRTIGAMVEYLESRGAQPAPAAPDGLTGGVLATFARNTGYSLETLGLDADLEADLGIDSVTLTSVLADLARDHGLDELDLREADFRTIAQVVDHLRSADRAPAPAPDSKAPVPVPDPETPARPDPPPARERATPGDPTGILADLRRRLDPARPFLAQGLGRAEQESIQRRVARRLGTETGLRLEDCDTVEKLEAFVETASLAAVEPLSPEPAPARSSVPPIPERRTLQDFIELPDPDLFAKTRVFARFMADRRGENAYWYGMPIESRCTNRVVIYDELAGRRREFLMFASNNYLGLANHPAVVSAVREAASRYGTTNTGSRIIGGTHGLHLELERRLARFKGTEAAIVFPSGYSANLGTISALVRRQDVVIGDKYNHMSIVDGCKIAGGQLRIYQHDDMKDLERVLSGVDAAAGKLIVTDGVFSMHGNVCNLPEIVRLARAHGARVLVDDAHSTGVLGRKGSGTSEHFGMKGEVDIELGTFSKTLAGVGGYVCAGEEVVEYLRFYANSYVFAATFPAHVAAGLIASLDVMETEPERLWALWRNIEGFKSRLVGLGFTLGESHSAIVPVLVGDYEKTLQVGRSIRDRGLFCQTVVYPGVSPGDERLRLSVTCEHTEEDLDLAAAILAESAREVGVRLAPSPTRGER